MRIVELEPPRHVEEVKPLSALLLYDLEERIIGTLHPLKSNRRGQAVIGTGQPLSHRDVQNLLDLLACKPVAQNVGLIPANVLTFGEDYLMWWSPTQVKPMWFLIQGQRYHFTVPWPSLVWIAHQKHLWCAALAEASRPQGDTSLYHAPLMNINKEGAVCIGNADIPESHHWDSLSDWEAIITQTNFCHVNHFNTLNKDQYDSVDTDQQLTFWQKNDGKDHFPIKSLNPMKVTLQDWMQAVLS